MSSFQLVGLTEVQATLADRWPALSDKVHQIARNTISRHLMRGDVFEQHGEDSYLVLFASLGAAEAEFKSRVITHEIARHLLGEGEAVGLGVTAKCTEISASALAAATCHGVLTEALERARPPSDPSPTDLSPAAKDGFPDDRPERGPGGASPVSAAGEGEAEAAPKMIAYSPIWDVGQMTLLRFRGAPRTAALGEPGDRSFEAEAFKIDLELIFAAADDLRSLASHGRRLPVSLAIRHSSLGSGSQRMELRRALGEIPSELRKLLTVEICRPEQEFWTFSCKAFLEMTRPLGISFSAMIELERPRAIPPPGSWLRYVAATACGHGRSEAEMLTLLTAFGARSRALGVDCAAYDLESRSLVLGAVGAGFRFLAGRAIHPETASIAKALRFEPLDLYSDLRRS
ncbi:MAG: hypothetical protein JO127_01645 [Caulobacteraceae bacterium]|nr:hypothetical protein [Caulobacteraceae bacterium]